MLKDVSFHIEPGEKLAIVGATGSGKSTIVRLLARFYDFAPGQMFLDGIDLMDIPSARSAAPDRHRAAGLPRLLRQRRRQHQPRQSRHLARSRSRRAARLVHAHDFITRLPNGYDEPLIERGQNLSQGQRQLLAFARVLAADPEILVLDEATASIDTETELLIQDALRVLTKGRTSIVIAHRLQTIQEADRVLVLQHGEVKEVGTHEQLLSRPGVYRTLYELQFQDTAA